MKARTFLILVGLLSSEHAYAWDAIVDGPDVFNKIKVVATESTLNNGLVIQCDSESDLFFAFIFRKKEFDDIPEVPAKLYVKTSESGPTILDATFRSWNDNYAGIVVSGRSDELTKVLADIGSAKKKIEIGYEALGLRESASFSSRRSGQTIATIFEKCKLAKPSD